MTVQDLITNINLEANEILDDEAEYIPYINAAIDFLSMLLVSMKDREAIRTMDISDNAAVPSDFMGFIPRAGYPAKIISGAFRTYDGMVIPDVSYTIKKNHISTLDDAVPFSELYLSTLVFIVSFLVKKKSLMIDYASADKVFITDVTNALQASKGG